MTSPLGYFQRIFIINLPARLDRRREMEKQLKSVGLSLSHPLVQLFAAIRPEEPGGFPSIGARGCFLSHLEVLRNARAQKLKRVLILEDDLNFSADFSARIAPLVEGLEACDWSMFYGGYWPGRPLSTAVSAGLAEIPPDTSVGGGHFLALNGAGTIGACIDYLEAILERPPGDVRGGPMHVDGAYACFRQDHPELRTLLAVPTLGNQRSSRTDIHDLKWFDRLPVAREAVGWLRQWKNA